MGQANTGCTPKLAPYNNLHGKHEECFNSCSQSACGKTLEPLGDQECADIALVQATVRGEVSDVLRALAMGAQPNTTAEMTLRMGEPTKKGRRGRAAHMTPLMRACELGHEDIAVQLLSAKASAVQCDSHGWTPLCHALAAGEVDVAKLLSQQPGFRLQQQKDICRKLQSEICQKCQKECDEDALKKLKREMEPGGLLFSETGAEHTDKDEINKRQTGAETDKVHPLLNEDQDLLTGEYPYLGDTV